MTTWVKDHFDTPDHALSTIIKVALVGGVAGFVLVLIGAYLHQ